MSQEGRGHFLIYMLVVGLCVTSWSRRIQVNPLSVGDLAASAEQKAVVASQQLLSKKKGGTK